MEIQETQTVVETPVETKPEVQLTQEQQMDTVKKTARMRHKALSQLARIHMADLLNDLAFRPGLSGNEKAALINTILDVDEFILDLGLSITNAKLSEKGKYAKRSVQLAGIKAQAYDNRMLLLASQLDDQQQAVAVEENNVETKTEETQDGIA